MNIAWRWTTIAMLSLLAFVGTDWAHSEDRVVQDNSTRGNAAPANSAQPRVGLVRQSHGRNDTPNISKKTNNGSGLTTIAPATKHIAVEMDTEMPLHGVSGTFSIVAADPESGICGAAVASKYPAVGKVVPHARAGVGAFCTQHWHNPDWGEQALDLLAAGKPPEGVLAELLRDDPRRGKRQLAVIDIHGRAANRNPDDADRGGRWWGAMSGRYYACQGNTLTGRAVITAMAAAYEETKGTLADRLMAALVAGDRAGGDHRGRLAAGIRLAKPGVDGYWLELHVDKHDDAVAELAKKYGQLEHEAKGR